MKKLFVKFSMLLILLGMSMNAAWALDINQAKIYLASLKAQTSPESTGSGNVKLTWLDMMGDEMDDELARALNNAAFGNQSHISEGETAQLVGGTLFAMDGIEMPNGEGHMFMTSFVYFLAEGLPANGSYFSHWTFTDPAISRIDTAMGNGDNIPFKSPCYKVLPDTANNGMFYKGTGGDEKFGVSMTNVVTNPNNIYAVFKKYLLSNPVAVNNGTATAEAGSSTTINVSVDVEGDMSQLKENYADFYLPGMPGSVFAEDAEGTWIWNLGAPSEMISPMKGRANIVITYTAKSGITAGTKRATFVAKMQGTNPSTINIPLAVEVRPESANEASVKIGEAEPTEYETLAAAVAAANGASGDVTLTILKNIEVSSSVTLSNTMTLDLNGYTLSAATVGMSAIPGMIGSPVLTIDAAGKTVNVAYNKQGGAIVAAPGVDLGNFGIKIADGLGVEVKAGTFVLNGGTVASVNEINDYTYNTGTATIPIQTAAVKVDAGATLIQNGATLTATSAGPNAFGIYNEGTVVIRDGSVRAEAGFNNAMAVYALNGSSTTIDGGSLSALAKEEDGTCDINKAIPAGISTWTNAYAVNVAAGSTVMVNGGDLYAEATNAERAYAVAALAGLGGTLTVNKGATVRAKSPNNMYSFPVALMAGDVTINGGKFDGKYMDNTTGETSNPAVFGVDYSKFTFVSGTCMTEKFFTEDDRFSASFDHPAYKNYSVINGSKDYTDGYRYIAVAEDADPAVAVPACRIGSVGYNTLEDAIAYANNNPNEEVVIFMMRDYTLPAGYYTLPAKATIVVPMSDEQAKEINAFPPRMSFNDMDRTHPYLEPTEFRRLTIANGVNMNVYGKIEMTCTQFASNEAYTGQPYGPYGRIVMEEGSHLTLMSGSEVRAWGFMTGKGEIDARRDAIVREMFQLGDWKGALTSVKITGMMPESSPIHVGDDSDKKIFPVSQYFIQNIESPVKYHPGAVLSTSAMVSEGLIGSLAVSMTASDIKIVGVNGRDSAIFVMDNGADAENTWVRKWYDVENDIQVYEVNNSAHIGQMVLDMGELDASFIIPGFSVPVRLNSGKFDLPITCNFKIHLLSGAMDFLQNTSLLPGAEVEVDKEATVSVAMDENEKNTYDAWVDGGKEGDAPISYTGALYVYDAANWGEYAYGNAYNAESGINETYTAYTKVVRYSPSWEGRPTKRDEQTCPPSAAINVHGTFQTSTGFVYTSANGANIFSSNEDAGTFIFNDNAVDAGERTVYNVEGSSTYRSLTFTPAQLKNGNGEHINTREAVAGDAYCYINDEWTTMYPDENNPCFMVKHNTNGDVFYAKPQEYVAVVATKDPNTKLISGNDDHTFSDAAGAGRLFILQGDCQWWEVEKKDNLYHCLHPNNDTYYYWKVDTLNKGTNDEYYEKYWAEKRFSITWKNWDGDTIKTIGPNEVLVPSYEVTYGTMAEFLGTNPTREPNIDYTYDFTGWTPALGPVTSDVTYTATYTQKQRKYTIIFCQEGGVEIERQFLTHNEVPVCENVPTKVGHTLVWSPAIAAVTRDTTYTATWLEVPPTKYEVTFFDYDGKTPLQQSDVAVGAMPEYTGDTPTGKATWAENQDNKEFTYVFDHWSPEIEKVSATSIKSYTAVYVESPLEYTITFKNENNSVRETQKYHYGETPVCSTLPTKAATAQYTYKLRWEPQIQTVMADATYKAVFDATTNKYAVSVKSNPSGACTISGAGIYDYNSSATITLAVNSGYTFNGWNAGDGDLDTTITVTADVNLVANFTVAVPDYTITWKSYDGNTTLAEVGQKANTATIYTGATPTKAAEAAYTYTFDGWTTGANGTGTFYKNNQTPKATVDATYYAHFTAVPVPDLTISNDNGAPTVLSAAVNYHDLIITSDGATYSGQLVGSNYLTLTGNAHFDLAINAKSHTWYAIAVPWQVNPTNGISVDGRTLTFGKDFDILYYDGSERAAGNAAWKYLELKEGDQTIQPGTLYMIGLMMDAPVVRFTKEDDAPLLTNTTSVTAYASSEETDANWNGIANPALFTAYVNAGATLGQVYNNDGSDSYSTINLSTTKLILGQPVFVQAPAGKDITVSYGGTYAAAPRRAKATETNEFEVRLSTYGAKYTDRLFVQTDEDKEADKYIIGEDLVKMGVSTRVAQMWINRYNTKLCMNTFAPINGVAEYPLGIYTPKNGEYRLSLATTPDSEASIYLTYDGEAIWNLAYGAYVADLEKGTNSHYGIRITVKKTPEIATGMDEAVVDSKDAVATKVLINNQVFIIRGDKVYSIDGQLVK